MPIIHPERLTQIRRVRGLGRPRLAKLTGLTERQIARLEGAVASDGTCTEEIIQLLASVLEVRPELLTSPEELTVEDLLGTQHPRSCSCC